MRFASLGSGSRGNSLVVSAGQTTVLVDCGFGLSEMETRLARLGLQASDLSAVLVTHEHTDHAGGVSAFARRFNLPVWLTGGTLKSLPEKFRRGITCNLIDDHSRFSIGDLEVQPFPVPHDAREPAQYVLGNGAWRLGMLTDAGRITPHIEQILAGCDALVLECNHDGGMLRDGRYPPPLKRRIAGDFGHLDNEVAAQLLATLASGRLQHVIAAHLSEQNNTPVLAQMALARALGCEPEWIGVADQDNGFEWRQLS